MKNIKWDELESTIGHQFNDRLLLQQALTHRSANKQHNERLEYLGDSILSFVIAEALFNQFPEVNEGDLTQMRSTLVCGETLAEMGKNLNLYDHVILGQGEIKTNGSLKESIIADVMESIIGATYLDSDIETAKKLILNWFQAKLTHIQPGIKQKDAKTRLQEYLQGAHRPRPIYLIIEVTGEDHQQEFVVQCRLADDDNHYLGKGLTRRKAEQAAAEVALKSINAND